MVWIPWTKKNLLIRLSKKMIYKLDKPEECGLIPVKTSAKGWRIKYNIWQRIRFLIWG